MLALEDMIRGHSLAARFLTRVPTVARTAGVLYKKTQEHGSLTIFFSHCDFCYASHSARKMIARPGPGVHVVRAAVTRDQGGSPEDKFPLILPRD